MVADEWWQNTNTRVQTNCQQQILETNGVHNCDDSQIAFIFFLQNCCFCSRNSRQSSSSHYMRSMAIHRKHFFTFYVAVLFATNRMGQPIERDRDCGLMRFMRLGSTFLRNQNKDYINGCGAWAVVDTPPKNLAHEFAKKKWSAAEKQLFCWCWMMILSVLHKNKVNRPTYSVRTAPKIETGFDFIIFRWFYFSALGRKQLRFFWLTLTLSAMRLFSLPTEVACHIIVI